MSLKDLQTRIITAPAGSGFTATGFLVASLRTWQWQTQSPCTPVQIGSVAFSAGVDSNIFILGTKAYLTSGKVDSTISIFNITNPLAPSLLGTGSFPVGTNPVVQNQPSGLTVLGNTLVYLDAAPGGLITVVDVTTPASPALLAQANSIFSNLTSIQGHGSLVYIQGNTNFAIYNLSLALQGSLTFAATGTGLLLNFPLAYALSSPGGSTSTLRVIDCSNPASPSVAATVTMAGPSTGSNRQTTLALDGTTLYVSSTANVTGDQQMFVYDVSGTTPNLINNFPLSSHVESFFVGSGCINSTDNTGPVNINIYSAANGGLIGSALVTSSVGPVSAAIVKASFS